MFIYGDTYKNVLECSLIMSFYHMVILRITKLINIAKKKSLGVTSIFAKTVVIIHWLSKMHMALNIYHFFKEMY